ncbi:hypothetical protein CLOP_g9304, partial [Closterium sp. NIES-67]
MRAVLEQHSDRLRAEPGSSRSSSPDIGGSHAIARHWGAAEPLPFAPSPSASPSPPSSGDAASPPTRTRRSPRRLSDASRRLVLDSLDSLDDVLPLGSQHRTSGRRESPSGVFGDYGDGEDGLARFLRDMAEESSFLEAATAQLRSRRRDERDEQRAGSDLENTEDAMAPRSVASQSEAGAGAALGGAGEFSGSQGDFFLGGDFSALVDRIATAHPATDANPHTPASRAAVQAMPLRIVREADVAAGMAACAVCHEEMEAGAVTQQMPCRHAYHSDCILPWLAQTNSCPVCRFRLPTQAEADAGAARPGAGGPGMSAQRSEGSGGSRAWEGGVAAVVAAAGMGSGGGVESSRQGMLGMRRHGMRRRPCRPCCIGASMPPPPCPGTTTTLLTTTPNPTVLRPLSPLKALHRCLRCSLARLVLLCTPIVWSHRDAAGGHGAGGMGQGGMGQGAWGRGAWGQGGMGEAGTQQSGTAVGGEGSRQRTGLRQMQVEGGVGGAGERGREWGVGEGHVGEASARRGGSEARGVSEAMRRAVGSSWEAYLMRQRARQLGGGRLVAGGRWARGEWQVGHGAMEGMREDVVQGRGRTDGRGEGRGGGEQGPCGGGAEAREGPAGAAAGESAVQRRDLIGAERGTHLHGPPGGSVGRTGARVDKRREREVGGGRVEGGGRQSTVSDLSTHSHSSTSLSSLLSVTPTRDVQEPTRDVQEPTRDVQEPTRDVQEPTRDVEEPTRDVQEPTRDVQEPTRDVQEPTRDVQKPTRDVQEPTRDVQEPTRDVEEPTRDVQEPTRDVQEPTRDVQEPTRYVQEPTRDVEEPTRDVQEPTRDVQEPTRDVEEPT